MRSFQKAAVLTVAASGMILAGTASASASGEAKGAAVGSPGVLSGNIVQVPIHIPINLCGNTVNVIALLNPTFGNVCANVG
ncbi:chaplin [Peterkaempfera bronchialis]|uniref:Chaplin n=1 Tax=Peterkaempfera bronchialis TaxID=2126346 RepID=A0A345SYZ5_9ACTN|nr:chaplin [Peterkaempfera bronchialis]AXI78950.1 chaplin [Peterkaempfera bronchialis]